MYNERAAPGPEPEPEPESTFRTGNIDGFELINRDRKEIQQVSVQSRPVIIYELRTAPKGRRPQRRPLTAGA